MIAVILAFVLVCIAALHVYWALGGAWGLAVAIPTIDERPLFTPSPATTWAVAWALAGAALVASLRSGILAWHIPVGPLRWAAIGLGVVFVLRAVGDFRYVGFFKRRRGSAFAARDTWLYSPLCVLIGIGFLLLAAR